MAFLLLVILVFLLLVPIQVILLFPMVLVHLQVLILAIHLCICHLEDHLLVIIITIPLAPQLVEKAEVWRKNIVKETETEIAKTETVTEIENVKEEDVLVLVHALAHALVLVHVIVVAHALVHVIVVVAIALLNLMPKKVQTLLTSPLTIMDQLLHNHLDLDLDQEQEKTTKNLNMNKKIQQYAMLCANL